jgi:hypothetical protein
MDENMLPLIPWIDKVRRFQNPGGCKFLHPPVGIEIKAGN